MHSNGKPCCLPDSLQLILPHPPIQSPWRRTRPIFYISCQHCAVYLSNREKWSSNSSACGEGPLASLALAAEFKSVGDVGPGTAPGKWIALLMECSALQHVRAQELWITRGYQNHTQTNTVPNQHKSQTISSRKQKSSWKVSASVLASSLTTRPIYHYIGTAIKALTASYSFFFKGIANSAQTQLRSVLLHECI